ncbi:TPA: hypothetical protein ACX6QF_003606 [Photobacterium damselae]
MIINDGCIQANPNIPDNERWGTKLGEKYYPFVRSLGGVSVFDFREFDVQVHNNKFGNDWATFIPCRSDWQSTIWIELDISKLGNNFKSGQTIREMWHKMKSSRKFISKVEGAVIGSIPISAFKQVLIYEKCNEKFRVFS